MNLPIDTYTVTFTADGFDTQKTPHIPVQADRTATLNVQLKIAAAATATVEVDAVPLMNAVDTTNGYVMDKTQIEAVPLPTGSFTGLATHPPASMRNCRAAPAPTPAWATRPSGPTASATPPTAFC